MSLSIFEDDVTFQFTEYKDQIQDKELFALFAYGIYSPEFQLNEKQQRKMKLLTLARISVGLKVVPFQSISKSCYLTTSEEIEELIIEAIQKGILIGKIDQNQRTLQVSWVISRDVPLDARFSMKDKLQRLHARVQKVREQL